MDLFDLGEHVEAITEWQEARAKLIARDAAGERVRDAEWDDSDTKGLDLLWDLAKLVGGTGRPRLIITHSRADGTHIDGTEPGNGVLAVARLHGFRMNRRRGRVEIPRSSGRAADWDSIQAAAAALRGAGFAVGYAINDTP
ncbi:hypothetical protein F5972_08485 [Microbispora cellulosiformans]|uniref:Uncharacterized protein n=1 Tax=Microbispora cellulosiformans TaxID=2614688 RepID=A0A5J5K8A5_9ACTN|nr:hypothetical protein [Microbispora cellulosiformans]KAA9379679.1 hypothetical protein F5972_08485 [Microbispora cellulosiformans]